MIGFLVGFFSVILVILSVFITLIVLMQRPSANAGMGSSLGGGIAESAFGGESGNVLTRYTIYGVVAFFILSFGLYLVGMNRLGSGLGTPQGELPNVSMMEEGIPGSAQIREDITSPPVETLTTPQDAE